MGDLSQMLTALGAAEPLSRQIGPYAIVERFDVALASLACRKDKGAEVASAAAGAGIPLPPAAGWAAGETFSALWVAPEMWIIEAPFATHENIVAHLKPLFGNAASLTEQTDAWVRFDLTAGDLTGLMERLCNVDFPKASAGHATRTVIEHVGCYLIKRDVGAVTLYGPRSSAQSLLHAIEVAAQSLL